MKKDNVIIFITFLILFSSFLATNSDIINIVGKSIFNIKATYESLSLRINVDASAPDVTIYYPLNDTYNYKSGISLKYFVSDLFSDISKVWYNIDNGNNVTLTGNTTFDVSSEGSHTLYIFANDSLGYLNNSKSITFFVDTSKAYIVIYNIYNGTTTNFSSLNRTQQENISNMTLDILNYGKVVFNQNINISNDGNGFGDQPIKVINLSAYSSISFNSIFINTNQLPQLDRQANLYLYNLTFSNPRILKDGTVCQSSLCHTISYSGRTLIFNVTGFTTYSTEETPTTPSGPGGGTSGGGGGGGTGERFKENPIEPIPQPVHKKGRLFDVTLLIPEKYRELFAGDTIVAEINIVNLRKVGFVDINVEYYIEDKDKNVVFRGSEMKAVENMISYLKKIDLPSFLESGYYVVYAKVTYEDDTSIAGYPFKIIEKEKPIEKPKSFLNMIPFKLMGTIFVILVASSIVIFFIYLGIKRLQVKIRWSRKDRIVINKRVKEIRNELTRLRNAYKEGYINKENYKKTKDTLIEKIKKLR